MTTAVAARASNLRGALAALGAFAIYSAHDVIVKALGGAFAPVQIIFFSTLMSFPVVALMVIREGNAANLRPVHPWLVGLRTLAMVTTTVCAFYAFSTLPMAQTYAIIFAAPLLITLIAIPVLGERVGWRRSLAVAVGLVGVIVVLQPGATPLSAGHLAAMTAAVAAAISAVIVRRIGGEERSAVLMLYPMLTNVVVMGAALPFVYVPMAGLELAGMAAIAAMGFAAALVHIFAYRSGSAAVVAPMQYSQILWAVLYGSLFFGETPDRATAIGAAIIVASGVYVVFREETVSTTRPVLATRTRYVIGVLPRISALTRCIARRNRGSGGT